MATVIRFARHGTKKRPFYRIVVQDKRSPRDGKFVEHIGSYDPLKNDTVTIERERLQYWLSTGAQMSTSVKNRLKPKRREWAGSTVPSPVPASSNNSPESKKAPHEAMKADSAT